MPHQGAVGPWGPFALHILAPTHAPCALTCRVRSLAFSRPPKPAMPLPMPPPPMLRSREPPPMPPPQPPGDASTQRHQHLKSPTRTQLATHLKQHLSDVVAAGSMVLCGAGWQVIWKNHRLWQDRLRDALRQCGEFTRRLLQPIVSLGVFDTLITIYNLAPPAVLGLDPPARQLIEDYQSRVRRRPAPPLLLPSCAAQRSCSS